MNKMNKTKACLEVTLEQARKWYESDNEDLKKLALTAFSEEVLVPSLGEILESEKDWDVLFLGASEQTKCLQTVANYLNNGWGKTEYTISLERVLLYLETDIKGVAMHQNVKYPGVVYFRTVADAQKAVKILGKKLLPLLK